MTQSTRSRLIDAGEREKNLLQDNHQKGEKMIMIVKTFGSQVVSSAPEREDVGEEGGEGEERRDMGSKSTVCSTVPKEREKFIARQPPWREK